LLNMLTERFSSSGHERCAHFLVRLSRTRVLARQPPQEERMHWRLYAQPRTRV
jgi:hypothetical protein